MNAMMTAIALDTEDEGLFFAEISAFPVGLLEIPRVPAPSTATRPTRPEEPRPTGRKTSAAAWFGLPLLPVSR